MARLTTHRTDRERGYVLLLAMMLIIGILGIAGVVIDVALAHLTQHEMETAAELGALEGLRWRDVDGDAARRQRAQEVVDHVFDDDFDPSTPEVTYHYGAGPSFTLEDANPPAAGVITLDDPPVWKPELAANDGNAQWGDLVAGEFHTGDHGEASDYTRDDFTAAPDPDASATAPSFLVRLRRVAHPTDGDLDGVASSVGPPLPFLFSWGSFATWLEDGITVRGTSIADAKPALATRVTDLVPGGLELSPMAIGAGVWAASAATGQFTLSLTGPDIRGHSLVSTETAFISEDLGTPQQLSAVPAGPVVVPLFTDDVGVMRIAGFAIARLKVVQQSVTVTVEPAIVAMRGATALSASAESRTALVALSTSGPLHDAHFAVAASPGLLLAPVLVR